MASLHTLPIELVYQILDNLDLITVICSVRDVCTRLNFIIDSYHRYQVKMIDIYCFVRYFSHCHDLDQSFLNNSILKVDDDYLLNST